MRPSLPKMCAVLAGTVLAVPFTLSAGRAFSASTSPVSTVAAADAFVDQSRPSANFGAHSDMRAGTSPATRSYLRFGVTGVSGTIARATLRLYSTDANAAGYKASATGGAWKENTVTWANAPAPGAAAGSSGPAAAGTWVSVDVTGLVAGNGTVNLVVTSGASAPKRIASREAASHAPRLLVEANAPTTTTTVPPTTTTTVPPTTTTTTTVPPTTTTTMGSPAPGCEPARSLTARQAQYNLLGYLWADGHFSGADVNFFAHNSCVADRFAADLRAVGGTASTSPDSGGGVHFHLRAVAPYDHPWDAGVPDATAAGVATTDDLGAFLAAVLEGEGSGSGKVLDDPSWGRIAGVVDLYRRVGVVVKPDKPAPSCGCASDPAFWNTYVDPAASTTTYNGYVAIIRSWPFTNLSRVPKLR